jgi:tungstate transport system substrate-binding protein
MINRVCLFAVVATLLLTALPALAQERFITVASTTGAKESGLFDHILPIFTAKTGITVRVVAVGTGRALDLGRRGEADVVFVHDTAAEKRFVAEGYGVKRLEVMYDDFVIVGPASDPARARGNDAVAALRRIAAAQAPFVSRGDRSGTHAAELRLWSAAGITPAGPWYRETGGGMLPTLAAAARANAYALTGRGTWLVFRDRGALTILVEGDPRLHNQYSVMLVNPERHSRVKAADGQAFIDWLVSPEGQAAIAAHRIDGQQLFFPNAAVPRRP